jgi:hypothetical protein
MPKTFSFNTDTFSLGSTNSPFLLSLEKDGDADIEIKEYRTSGTGPILMFKKARGSKTTPSAVGNGHETGKISFRGYGDTDFKQTAIILSRTEGTISDTSSAGYLQFYTTPSGSTGPIHRMIINANGDVGIGIGDGEAPSDKLEVNGTISATGYKINSNVGFTGTGTYTNFTIENGIITNAT